MGIFSDLKKKVIEKKREMDERREFLNRVEEKVRPFRRTAYMKQMMKEAVKEGITKAKLDAEARLPKPKPKDEELGIMSGMSTMSDIENPFKFMNQKEVKKNGNIQKEKTSCSNSTRRRRKSRGIGRR